MEQCVAVCCSMLQYAAVCCSVLQRVAVCCSVLQCVAAAKCSSALHKICEEGENRVCYILIKELLLPQVDGAHEFILLGTQNLRAFKPPFRACQTIGSRTQQVSRALFTRYVKRARIVCSPKTNPDARCVNRQSTSLSSILMMVALGRIVSYWTTIIIV